MFALLWTLFIIVSVWFLLIRPQRRRAMEHAALVAALEPGQRVITAGGMYGRIEDFEDDDVVRLEVAPGTVLRVDRRAVTRNLDAAPPQSPVSETTESEEDE